MIRNSDIIFSKTAASFNFISKETARRCVKEVAALHGLGVDKRLPVLLYEQGHLEQDQVYAVLECMIANRQLKKIRKLWAYRFEEEDDTRFIEGIQINAQVLKQALLKQKELAQEGIEREIEDILSQEYGCLFTPDKLSYCLDVQQKMEEAGFPTSLLGLVTAKGWLNERLAALIPDIERKKLLLVNPQARTQGRIRRNYAILVGQLACEKGILGQEDFQQALFVYQKTANEGVKFRFTEILFYLGLMDEAQLLEVNALYETLCRKKVAPRIYECHFDEDEAKLFEDLLAKNYFPASKVAKCRKLQEQLRNCGLSLPLCDLFLIKGYFKRSALLDVWEKLMAKEIAGETVQEQQITQTIEEVRVHREENRSKTMALEKQVLAQVQSQARETHALEDELAQEYISTASERAAVVQKDLAALKKSIRHADRAQRRQLQAKLRYYRQSTASSRLRWVASVACFLLVLAILGWSWHYWQHPDKQTASPVTQRPVSLPLSDTDHSPAKPVVVNSPTLLTPAALKSQLANAHQEFLRYQFSTCLKILQNTLTRVKESERPRLRRLIKRYQEEYRLFQRLVRVLQSYQGKTLDVFPKSPRILAVTEKEFTVEDSDFGRVCLPWHRLKPVKFLRLFEDCGLAEACPFTMAKFAAHLGYLSLAETYLFVQLKNHPASKPRVDQVYAELLNRPVPPGGFAIYQGHLIPAREKARYLAQEKERLARTMAQARQRDAAKARAEAQRRRREREALEFSRRFEAINEFVRTYEYQRAIAQFRAWQQELSTPELRRRIAQRIAEIEPYARLFQRLITDINSHRLINDDFPFGKGLTAKITRADKKYVVFRIPQGEYRQKWCYLKPDKLAAFFQRLALSYDEQFLVGCFCFEKQLLKPANKIFIQLLKKHPQIHPRLNRYLAHQLGIAVPARGFVPYKGVLITPKEKEYRSRGLVRYGNRWVTPEEREKLEAGYVRHGNQWITQTEKELLRRGYVKYQGKWYTKDGLAQIRRQWEHAWTLETTHYNIRCNISAEFIEELGRFIEAAYRAYYKFFGRKARRRMTIFAFRTYEDYRNYCLSQNQANQLKAGGFASSKNMTGVGWARGQGTARLLEVLIHEAAHLYHYNSCPNANLPSWYAEAVATQFEGYEWDGQHLEVHYRSKYRLQQLKRFFGAKDYYSIEDLVKGNALAYINNDAREAAKFYAQCWGLYYFLAHTLDTKLQQRFQTFCNDMNLGKVHGSGQFLAYFQNLPTLEKNWREFILALH